MTLSNSVQTLPADREITVAGGQSSSKAMARVQGVV